MAVQKNPLRTLLDSERPLVAPGAYSALSARTIEDAGFSAVYLTGYGAEASYLAVPDIGLQSRKERIDHLQMVADAVSIPIIVDLEQGYGDPISVAHSVRQAERAGASAFHLDDQASPMKCPFIPVYSGGIDLVAPKTMIHKIEAAADARTQDSLIIVRSDVIVTRNPSIAEQIERASAYVEAGADIILASCRTHEDFRRMSEAITQVPLCAAVAGIEGFGQDVEGSVAEFGELGYRLLLYPALSLYAAAKAEREVLKSLKESGRADLGLMVTHEEMLGLLRVDKYTDQAVKYS